MTKTLPLTILFYEGPIARAYLQALKAKGLRARRIVILIPRKDVVHGKPIAPLLPPFLRKSFAKKAHDLRANFWSRKIAADYKEIFDTMRNVVTKVFDFPVELPEETLKPLDYSEVAELVDEAFVDGLGDPQLLPILSQHLPTAILYTGGGIVPRDLLSIRGIRFLHVHPGYLPHIRGADVLLWSILVRGKPGVSCFYMKPEIDLGDVILAEEIPNLTFPTQEKVDDQLLYRAVYSFYDPYLRAAFLLKVLEKGADPASLSCRSQSEQDGITYHFMNPVLRRRVLKILFPGT